MGTKQKPIAIVINPDNGNHGGRGCREFFGKAANLDADPSTIMTVPNSWPLGLFRVSHKSALVIERGLATCKTAANSNRAGPHRPHPKLRLGEDE